jgi:hypothetical protein
MEGLYRIGVKIFCSRGAEIDLAEFIPVFHRWIQQKRTSYLLVDVADYSHVPQGPGVMLVAHEGNFCVDERVGRRGLCLYRKQPLDGALDERIASVARQVVAAAGALAREPEFAGRLGFSGSEIQVFFNDRLLAPNIESAFEVVASPVRRFLESALGTAEFAYERERDPRARMTVTGRRADAGDIAAMAARLGV